MLVSRLVHAVFGWSSMGLLVGGLMLGGTMLAGAGCSSSKPAAPSAGGSDAHGHSHDHDLAVGNYAESVGSLRKVHDQIKSAFEAGKVDEAHDLLHHIGDVFEALEKQVDSVAADKRESASTALQALIAGYGNIDGAMHEGKDINYAEMGSDLAGHVETLEAAK